MNSVNGAQNYPVLWAYMEGLPGTDNQKNQAIEVCLRDPTFVGRMEKTKVKHVLWIKTQLGEKLSEITNTSGAKQKTWLIAGSIAVLLGLSATLITITNRGSVNKGNKKGAEIMSASSPNFSHDKLLKEVVPWRYPLKPYKFNHLQGDTLHQKVLNFITDNAQNGDPIMQRMKDFLQRDDWEIKFVSPEEAEVIMNQQGRAMPPELKIALAMNHTITKKERNDGIQKNLGLVILNKESLSEEVGIHRFAGIIVNEMTGFIYEGKDRKNKEMSAQITYDGQNYSIPDWAYELASDYVLCEALSHLADQAEEDKVATNNPKLIHSPEKIWESLCENLRQGKFSPTDPQNYARIYFVQGLKKMGFPDELINGPSFQKTLEELYQKGISCIESPENKREFMENLARMGVQ